MRKGRSIFLATLLMVFMFSGVSQAMFTYTYSNFDQQIVTAPVGETFSLNLSMDYGTAVPGTGNALNDVSISLNFNNPGILSIASFTAYELFDVTDTGEDSWSLVPTEPINVGTSGLLLGTFEFNTDATGETLITANIGTESGDTLYDVPANSIGVAENPVPIPAAAWMLGSGLLGFGLIRRRK